MRKWITPLLLALGFAGGCGVHAHVGSVHAGAGVH